MRGGGGVEGWRGEFTHVGFDTWVQLLQVVDVAAHNLDILEAILRAGSAPEGKDCSAPLQPAHMHL